MGSQTEGTAIASFVSRFLARVSYSLARTPVLPLFAASFGVGPEAIGFAVAISTVTRIFFKMPAGVLSDVIGRTSSDLYMLDFFGWRSFEKLVEELDGNGFDLMDCNKELYPTINDYTTSFRVSILPEITAASIMRLTLYI